jgi:hypothetical protein
MGAASLCCCRLSKQDWLLRWPQGRVAGWAGVSHAGLPPTPLPPARCPRSWVPSTQDITQMGIRDVHHENNQAGQGNDNVRHGDDHHGQGHVSSRSIRPGTARACHRVRDPPAQRGALTLRLRRQTACVSQPLRRNTPAP